MIYYYCKLKQQLLVARNFFENHEYQEALEVCHKMLDNGIRGYSLLYLTAACCIQLNRLEDAKEFLHQASIDKPISEKVWLDIGRVCSRLLAFDEGLEAYRNALQINPQSSTAFNGLAVILAQSGDINLSVQHIETAYQLEPENISIQSNRTKIVRVWNIQNGETKS